MPSTGRFARGLPILSLTSRFLGILDTVKAFAAQMNILKVAEKVTECVPRASSTSRPHSDAGHVRCRERAQSPES